jgi:hypothetical protein
MTNLPRNDHSVLARLARGGRGGGVPGPGHVLPDGSHLGHSVPLIPMNLAMVIAVYAVISKHLGVPLRFPGKPLAYRSLIEMTDAGLLARAMVWAATDPRAANQAYNINNGDMFRWEEMWPALAGYFGLPVAPGLPVSLATVMGDKQPVWDEIVARHGLAPTAYRDVSSWAFGDGVFSWGLRPDRRRLQGQAPRLPRVRRHRQDVHPRLRRHALTQNHPARLTIPTPPASPSRLGRGGDRVQQEVAGR